MELVLSLIHFACKSNKERTLMESLSGATTATVYISTLSGDSGDIGVHFKPKRKSNGRVFYTKGVSHYLVNGEKVEGFGNNLLAVKEEELWILEKLYPEAGQFIRDVQSADILTHFMYNSYRF